MAGTEDHHHIGVGVEVWVDEDGLHADHCFGDSRVDAGVWVAEGRPGQEEDHPVDGVFRQGKQIVDFLKL